MAKFGLSHMVAAPLTEASSGASYEAGFIIGKAISATIAITTNEAKLYADDALAETIKEFSSGTLTLGTDDLEHAVQASLLGHTVTASGEFTANTGDVAPYVGVGFYARSRKKGVDKWRAVWLHKVIFSEPTDEFATKAETPEFKTPTVEGTISPLENGDWKTEKLCDTKAAAVTWLNTLASITS